MACAMTAKLYDIFNFCAKLSLPKLINAIKLLGSFYLMRWKKAPSIQGVPMTLSIEPTTACNLRCPECPSGLRSFTRPTGRLESDFFRSVIDQCYDTLIYLIFYFQGEPYLNPDFLEMVSHASDKNIYTITSTNGHFLNDENARKTVESGLDRLIISIDGTTQETYEQYRIEGKLDHVLAGARNIVKWKRKLKSHKPYVIFQYLVVKPNEHQIPEVYKLAKDIGIDEVKLKTAQIYDYKNGNPLIPSIDKYSRYEKGPDGTYDVKYDIKDECWKMWHSAVITWDGCMIPCCFDKDAQHVMGDVKQDSLEDIWQSEPYQNFRKQLISGRGEIDICTNCSEGCQVFF